MKAYPNVFTISPCYKGLIYFQNLALMKLSAVDTWVPSTNMAAIRLYTRTRENSLRKVQICIRQGMLAVALHVTKDCAITLTKTA